MSKLFAPSAARNAQFIGDALKTIVPLNAAVLEIASGTGQHGAHFCKIRSDLKWHFSDIDDASRKSQDAYAADNPAQFQAPIIVDVMADKWWQNSPRVQAIYCANMIHISPWEAALGLAEGAPYLLPSGGLFMLYGPFFIGADDAGENAASNMVFDEDLKRRNPLWGVRNLDAVKHIFADSGLGFQQLLEMPRDNSLLVFKKS